MRGTVELKTKRLILRRHKITDAEVLFNKIGCDSQMTRYTGWNPYATLEDAYNTVQGFIESYDDGNFYGWAIELEGELIGTIGAYDYDSDESSVELGFSIVRGYWNQGYASEALDKVIHYLCEAEGIKMIHAWCAEENKGSSFIMEKVGMEQIAIQKNALHVGENVMNKLIYARSFSIKLPDNNETNNITA